MTRRHRTPAALFTALTRAAPTRAAPTRAALVSVALSAALVGTVVLSAAEPATAVTVAGLGVTGRTLAGPVVTGLSFTGHGEGHRSPVTGSWLGSYRLADGRLAYCLEIGKQAPTGHDYSFVPAASLGRYSPDDAARLAHISRTWGSTTDPEFASAAQLATWTIAGLGGHSQAELAARAGDMAGTVIEAANQMLAAADGPGGASRGVSAAVTVTPVDGSGKLAVVADLTVDFLDGGQTPLPGGRHQGTLRLEGAVFDDGSRAKSIVNGETYPITADGSAPAGPVVASAAFDQLPYGQSFEVGLAGDSVQNVLLSGAISARGTASASVTAVSGLPFQPRVATQVSAATAEAGAAVSDRLIVSADAGGDGGLLPTWGVYRYGGQRLSPGRRAESGGTPEMARGEDDTLTPPALGTMLPIPVVVESSLLGPFSEPVVPAETPPSGAPVVCTVEVLVTEGPGTYRTPECVLPAAGHYVWVERIVPERTPADQGGDRVLPWQAPFGSATEVTHATAPESPIAATPPPLAAPGSSSPQPTLADTGVSATGLAAPISFGLSSLLGGVLCLRRAPRRALRRSARRDTGRDHECANPRHREPAGSRMPAARPTRTASGTSPRRAR